MDPMRKHFLEKHMEFNFKKVLIASTTCLVLAGCAANETGGQYSNDNQLVGQSLAVISEQLVTTENLNLLEKEDGSLLVEFPGIQAFSFDGASISNELQTALTDIAAVLIDHNEFGIDVLGHTDNTGSVDYNNTLSENRARQVADFLIQQGILPDRITSIGMGPSSPIADNRTAQGRAANRRVELLITQ